jgi:hypothetical protein
MFAFNDLEALTSLSGTYGAQDNFDLSKYCLVVAEMRSPSLKGTQSKWIDKTPMQLFAVSRGVPFASFTAQLDAKLDA